MLRASAQSPAMLFYLDNQFNRRGNPNENYARELMELHTLGVHGGYTQRDVQEVARCFTGRGVETRAYRYGRGRFRFDPDLHDSGPKRVLGHAIDAGGIEDGLQVLDLLATHPSTARFLATKLARYFLGEATTDAVERGSKAYLSSGGDIRSTLRALLTEQAVLEGPPIVRRPYDFAVAALRALHADTDGGKGLQRHLDSMGQPLFQWPMPDGYPDNRAAPGLARHHTRPDPRRNRGNDSRLRWPPRRESQREIGGADRQPRPLRAPRDSDRQPPRVDRRRPP
jgi:uncharacterized protein (DUF1800 family)